MDRGSAKHDTSLAAPADVPPHLPQPEYEEPSSSRDVRDSVMGVADGRRSPGSCQLSTPGTSPWSTPTSVAPSHPPDLAATARPLRQARDFLFEVDLLDPNIHAMQIYEAFRANTHDRRRLLLMVSRCVGKYYDDIKKTCWNQHILLGVPPTTASVSPVNAFGRCTRPCKDESTETITFGLNGRSGVPICKTADGWFAVREGLSSAFYGPDYVATGRVLKVMLHLAVSRVYC